MTRRQKNFWKEPLEFFWILKSDLSLIRSEALQTNCRRTDFCQKNLEKNTSMQVLQSKLFKILKNVFRKPLINPTEFFLKFLVGTQF